MGGLVLTGGDIAAAVSAALGATAFWLKVRSPQGYLGACSKEVSLHGTSDRNQGGELW